MFKLKPDYYKLLLILFFLIAPWFVADYSDSVKPVELVQEDNSFFEINTCDISIGEFFVANPSYIYQDHYFFNFNPNSSIGCFGKIVGVSINNEGFFISVGANPLINFLIQSALFLLIFSFFKKDEHAEIINKPKHYISLLFTTYLFTFSIYAEKRFYSNTIFDFQFNDKRYYVLIFIIFYWVGVNLISLSLERIKNLIYIFPFMFFIPLIFIGSNLSIYLFLFTYFGIYSFINKSYLKKTNIFYFFFSIFWLFNSTGRYYLEPTKLRGFSSSSYEFNTNLFWIIVFFTLYNGIYYIYRQYDNDININKFINYFTSLSIPLVTVGYIGSNIPLLNFFSEYYFGLQRNITTQSNPFIFNQWSEKISWRGMYQSAESIGEFYGLCLFFITYLYLKKYKLSLLNKFAFIFSLLGLYFSDNRTSILLYISFVLIFLIFKSKYKKVLLVLGPIFFILTLVYLVGFQNFQFPYEYMSSFLYKKGLDYKVYYETSSFLNLLEKQYDNNSIFVFLFGLFSSISFLLNRGELWALFIARFNPTYSELLFGTGPLNFGNLYGEINVIETNSFYLPHSSFLSFLVFFGIVGLGSILISLVYNVIVNKRTLDIFKNFVIIFIFVNVFKNDSLNYIANFTNYFLILLLIFNNLILKVSEEELK